MFSDAESAQQHAQNYGVNLITQEGNASMGDANQQKYVSSNQQFIQNIYKSRDRATTILKSADKNIVKAWEACMTGGEEGGWKMGPIFRADPRQIDIEAVFRTNIKPYALQITDIKANEGVQCNPKSITLDRASRYVTCTRRDPYKPMEVTFVSDRDGEKKSKSLVYHRPSRLRLVCLTFLVTIASPVIQTRASSLASSFLHWRQIATFKLRPKWTCFF
jgi:hypothetical protein